MDAGTVLAIVVPNVVTGTAIMATWKQGGRELRLNRGLSDLDHVREVLDDAAVALHRAAYRLDDVRSYLTQYGGSTFFKTDDGTELYKKLGAHGEELDALTERLRIRFGRDHDVAASFTAADEAVLAIWRAAGLMRLEPEPDGSPSAEFQIRQLNQTKRAEIERQRTEFDAAREQFIDAAQRTAGAHLPRGSS